MRGGYSRSSATLIVSCLRSPSMQERASPCRASCAAAGAGCARGGVERLRVAVVDRGDRDQRVVVAPSLASANSCLPAVGRGSLKASSTSGASCGFGAAADARHVGDVRRSRRHERAGPRPCARAPERFGARLGGFGPRSARGRRRRGPGPRPADAAPAACTSVTCSTTTWLGSISIRSLTWRSSFCASANAALRTG